jgi:hypothetical protein
MREITFQKALEQSDVPMAKLGEKAVTADGRAWRYVKANEALSLGHALTRTANVDVDTVASSTDGDGDIVYITEASAGWTVGAYENAYGLVDDGTNEGQFFKVETNSTDTLKLYKDFKLTTALTVAAADDIVLVLPFLAEKAAITTINQIPLGVAQKAFTTKYYGWVLERGPGLVIAGAALVVNEFCTPGDDTEGEVVTVTSNETVDDPSGYGRCLVANTTADKAAMIDVNLW